MQESQTMNNPILRQVEDRVESQLTTQNRGNYMKVVVAGMKAGMQGGPNSIIASIRDSKNVIHDCAVGAINLVLILANESRGTMPIQAMVPAAMTLMLKALDFAEKQGAVQISDDVVDRAVKTFDDEFCKRVGVTGQMINHAMGKIQEISNDPQSVKRMKIVSGEMEVPEDLQDKMKAGGANVPA